MLPPTCLPPSTTRHSPVIRQQEPVVRQEGCDCFSHVEDDLTNYQGSSQCPIVATLANKALAVSTKLTQHSSYNLSVYSCNSHMDIYIILQLSRLMGRFLSLVSMDERYNIMNLLVATYSQV